MRDKIALDDLPLDLGDGLELRWADLGEEKRLIDLAFLVLDEGEEAYPFVKILLQDWAEGKFPLLQIDDFTVVEDHHNGEIVSAMCLFSTAWRYGQTAFKVGRPELVMTHPDYRRRGLIRRQMDVIHTLSESRGEVMQVITGIPSLYRAFGYEPGLELGGGYRIYPPSFPKLAEGRTATCRLRVPRSAADRAFVRELHQANTRAMLFSMDVPADHWTYEFDGYRDGSDGKFHWCLIEDREGEPLGYLHHDHIFWGSVMDINFLALKSGVGYLSLLPHLLHGLWDIAQRKFEKDSFKHPAEKLLGLYLHLGREHPIYDAIGRDLMLKAPPYAWYVRFPDEVAYLRAIRPQLERHLMQSPVAAGYSGELRLNFYQRGALLRFHHGRLDVEGWQPADGSDGDAHFPANTFWSVLCGQKRASALGAKVADCWMSRTARALLEALFPPFTGQVWVVGGGG